MRGVGNDVSWQFSNPEFILTIVLLIARLAECQKYQSGHVYAYIHCNWLGVNTGRCPTKGQT